MSLVSACGEKFNRQDLAPATGVPDGRWRTPVVMLHGLFTGSVASWFFTCAPGVSRHRQVVLFDQRGHGLTPATPTGYGSSRQAADLAALTCELPPFVVVGHSFGALIAARFAVAHPHRVRGLVLVEPPLGARLPSARAAGGAVDTARWLAAAGVDVDALGRRGLARIEHLLEDTTLRADLAGEPPFTDAEVARLPRPLAIVFGTRSLLAPLAGRVRRAVPDAEVHLLDAGHGVHVDATGELTDVLVAFMARCDPPGPGDGNPPRPDPGQSSPGTRPGNAVAYG